MGLLDLILGRKPKWQEAIESGASLIDVRSPAEYKSGHVKGSKNIPVDKISASISKINKDKPVIVYCASGMRSGMAKGILKSNGFEAYNAGTWTKVNNFISK